MSIFNQQQLQETTITLIAEGTRIEGSLFVEQLARFHGTLIGDLHAKEGSTLILSESALVEGDIQADTVTIDGFVRGNIVARIRVVISGTGRVVGNIRTPSLKLEFGAYFEGRSQMEEDSPRPTPIRPASSPA